MSLPQPPYGLQTEPVGGVPTMLPDLPITSVLTLFFAFASLLYFILLLRQIRRRQKWTLSALLLLLASERVAAYTVRIVWIFRPANIEVAITARLLLHSGVIVLYLCNLLYVGAIVRAETSSHTWLTVLQTMISMSAMIALIIDVVSMVVEAYTLNTRTLDNCVFAQCAMASFFVALAMMPLPLLVAAYFGHRRQLFRFMKSTWIDGALVVISTLLCMLVAGSEAGVSWETERHQQGAAWYLSRTALYLLQVGPEVAALITYMLGRVERRINALQPGDSQGHIYKQQDVYNGGSTRPTALVIPGISVSSSSIER